jgi:hypothetical protein
VTWLNVPPGNDYAGGAYYYLEFTNLSGHSAVSLNSRQLGSPAGRGSAKATTVTLASGQTATAKLQITDTGNYSQCFQRLPQGPGQPGLCPQRPGCASTRQTRPPPP